MSYTNIEDKISTCFTTEQTQYTDFLNPEELSESLKLISDTGLRYFLSGGYDWAERKMIALSLTDVQPDFPICVLCGKWDKFSDIGHRDILGAVLASGIERRCIGDIIVNTEQREFYLFVIIRMSDYISTHVATIGRASVVWSKISSPVLLPTSKIQYITLTVSSARIDCIIAAAYNFSRQQSQSLIHDKRVFVNHSLVQKLTQQIVDKDVVIVRGYGKFIIESFNGISKKGKRYIQIKKFI